MSQKTLVRVAVFCSLMKMTLDVATSSTTAFLRLDGIMTTQTLEGAWQDVPVSLHWLDPDHLNLLTSRSRKRAPPVPEHAHKKLRALKTARTSKGKDAGTLTIELQSEILRSLPL